MISTRIYILSVLTLFISLSRLACFGQIRVTTSDVTNFWVMFDSLQNQKDSLKQLEVINQLYLDKGSTALSALLKMDSLDASIYLKLIKRRRQRWTAIRQRTIDLAHYNASIDSVYSAYKQIYPAFHSPVVSFIMGCFGRGGTTTQEFILVGTEVMASDTTQSLAYLKKSTTYLVAHELGHVQQDYVNKVTNEEEYKHLDLLGWAIMEGSCDFVAEQVLAGLPSVAYIAYGRQHEQHLWHDFQPQMYQYKIDDWLYNGGSSRKIPADLGYFIGYAICKSYYQKSVDKRKAIQTILNINYTQNEHHAFFKQSGYAP